MIFRASLDRLAKGITIGVSILFTAIIIVPYLTIEDNSRIVSHLVNFFLLLIYLITYSLRPQSYTLTNAKLIVNRNYKNVEIEIGDVKSIEQIGKEQISHSMRTFGVGGLFGYFGKFQNTQIGSMTWYATRLDKTVLIITNDNKRIILTPDNRKEFVAHFARHSSLI